MNNYKQHITFRIATLLIVVCLVLPSVVKFTHVFAHHEHEVCLGENQSHLHELDSDCEFYKFNINHNTILSNFEFVTLEVHENQSIIASRYLFLSSFQKLHFSLRGPPFNS
ncbi:hypothetical protein [Psychroserpens mesophilus]|uniref:hypothetical protein n=1 Tax=Psychroserpens mesophilus TaxID=325473 RepID=UPI000694C2FA|nr:hypothetical protein [Psychroserpens mesophilus]